MREDLEIKFMTAVVVAASIAAQLIVRWELCRTEQMSVLGRVR